MNFITFFHSFHFSLFSFSKIAGVYLQNIPRFYFAVTAFLFQLMRFCIVASASPILVVFLFWRYQADYYNILQNWFFTLRKELIIQYIFPISPHRQKNFLRDSWSSIVFKSNVFSMHILIIQVFSPMTRFFKKGSLS